MLDYKTCGVDAQKKEAGLNRLLEHVTRTFDFNSCKPLLPIGYFANVIDLRPAGFPIGIAFCTDGVGTKLLIAERMGKYDTVGIDCVAMNVNDVLCVGATPISMVDYIAVSQADPFVLEEISRGLYRGCEMARINLSGGEIAQVAELLANKEGHISFDIVGTAIGTVDVNRIIVGQNLEAGDRLVGLQSNGLHSNGYTLARKICFDAAKLSVDTYIADFGKTLGEELLMPTRIYVREVLEILKTVEVKGLFHITGDGLFNITRTKRAVGYRIESFPEPAPIFQFLQRTGNISWPEMFRVFNMGIGFVVAIPDDSSSFDIIQKIAKEAGYDAFHLGHVVEDPDRTISLEPYQLISRSGTFQSQ